jgi:hypothetical protein
VAAVASRARALLAPLAALAAALAVAGCVSVPTAGPVLSYPLAQQTSGQNGQNVQVVAAPPGNNWKPNEIVTGFLTAAAAIGDQQQVAMEYLTPQAAKTWKPLWSANVYSAGPFVQSPFYQRQQAGTQKRGKSAAKDAKKSPEEATVSVDGKISAILSGHGTYAAASSSDGPAPQTFQLEKTPGGQWRISSAPSALLLTQGQFTDDYELRNLYFFDPSNHYLVPDPVYVPLQASTSNLMNRLVYELIFPPKDWLAGGATQTALPAATKIIGVTLSGGTAAVNLGGAIATAPAQTQKTLLAQVSSQLLWTLIGSGQGGSQVQSVELLVNGKPWSPPSSPNNPVQVQSQAADKPASGASKLFYYVDSAGYLCSRDGVAGNQVQIAKIGTGYSQIAVSPDGKYLGALRNGLLYMGSVNGPLAKLQGSGYTTISWDPTDNLWTTSSGQILTFRGGMSTASAQVKPIQARVVPDDGEITAVRIAPDGVRVALVIDGNELTFGAIGWQQGPRPGLAGAAATIALSPFSVSNVGFTAVTWYGPNNVITLDNPGSTLTEYPVNGGTSTSQLLDQPVDSITASSGQALIAGVAKGGMTEALSLTGAWVPVSGKGISPTYPG